VDREGIVRYCQGRGMEAVGLSAEESVGRHWQDVFGGVSELEGVLRRMLSGESFQVTLDFEDGGAFELSCVPLFDEGGEVTGAVGLGINVTDRKQSGRQQFADLEPTKELLRFHEQDRRLIAYEIHDGFVQEATSAMMHLETLLDTGRIPEGGARQEVELALQLVRKAVAEARRLISGLRPPILDELGVVAAIAYLIDDQPPGGPSIDFRADVQFDRLEPVLEGTIYRIVQEAVTNVGRHSGSDRAEIRLTQVGEHLQMEVRDWGIGFDPNVIQGKRFGLRGISERARLLGGRAEIDSKPGLGTRVLVDLPLARVPAREVATR
jgi:signal transduction histidine kinase